MRRLIFAFVLALLLLAFSPDVAASQTPSRVQTTLAKADAYWTAQTGAPGPCAGRYAFAWTDLREGVVGKAPDALGEGIPGACRVLYDAAYWQMDNTTTRCIVLFHEVGHYYDRVHEEHERYPVMTSGVADWLYFEPCATMRERIVVALGGDGAMTVHGTRDVHCGLWEGRVLPCRVRLDSGKVVRYRVSTRGERFVIRRQKA